MIKIPYFQLVGHDSSLINVEETRWVFGFLGLFVEFCTRCLSETGPIFQELTEGTCGSSFKSDL